MGPLTYDDNEIIPLLRSLYNASALVEEDGSFRPEGGGTQPSQVWGQASSQVMALLAGGEGSPVNLEELRSFDAQEAFVEIMELYRRLLLAAGNAFDWLGAATSGRRGFSGLDEALEVYAVSRGEAARRIGRAIALALDNTPSFTDNGAIELPPDGCEGSWIAPCSLVGMKAMLWAYASGPSCMDHAWVRRCWPGPVLYGSTTEEESVFGAVWLCEALASVRNGAASREKLAGTRETSIRDGKVGLPSGFLDDDPLVYLTPAEDEIGSYIYCQGQRRRDELLARLILSEQSLGGDAWGASPCPSSPDDECADVADRFEEEFRTAALCDYEADVDEDGRVDLCDFRCQPGFEEGSAVTVIGAGDHFLIRSTAEPGSRRPPAQPSLPGIPVAPVIMPLGTHPQR